jgi:hypothetical protein
MSHVLFWQHSSEWMQHRPHKSKQSLRIPWYKTALILTPAGGTRTLAIFFAVFWEVRVVDFHVVLSS